MGLPTNIQDKLKRGKMKTIENIVEELARFEKESFGKKQPAEVSTKEKSANKTVSKSENIRKPCPICFRLFKATRFHPENECWHQSKNVNNIFETPPENL